MQIRYRITITYAITVAIILLILVFTVYFLSSQDRITQYHQRLRARAFTTLRLLQAEQLQPELVRKLTRYPAAALYQRSITVYDSAGTLIFADNDDNAKPVYITPSLKLRLQTNKEVYFKSEHRDALALVNKGNTILIAAYDEDRIEWLSKLQFILFFSFFMGIALVFIVGYVFSLRLVHSISVITGKVQHITTRDLSLRLDEGKQRDELEQLAHTINELLKRLQHSFETQGRFIDNASHELSTPLAVILSQIDISRQKQRSTEEYQELMDSLYEDVSRLDVLVKSLLDLAKIQGSPKGVELADIRLDDLLMDLPPAIRKLNPAYKVSLTFEEFPEDDSKLSVFGNEPLLFCAFYNVVHNACKYSAGGTPQVRMRFEQDGILVAVEDNGPGIDKAELEYVFQPFYRGMNINHNKIPGIGLGLSLAQNIIKLHNGRIWVESLPEKGTTFFVKLRYKEQP